MKQFQTFECQLMPNDQQEQQMRLFAGSCRFVYNKAWALQKQRYEQGERKLGYGELCKLLTEWRKSTEMAWLSRVPIHLLQQELKDLERACANFFARDTDFPKFKKKTELNSFCYPDPKQIKLDQTNSRIFLPKLGWLRYHNSQEVLGDLRNVTVSRGDRPVARTGKWFVSIQTEREVEPSIPKGNAVGGDLGVARLATLPDGSFYTSLLDSFKQHETALRKAQQSLRKARKSLSRKVNSSNNWEKAKVKVHKIYTRIANIRRDLLYKLRKTSNAIGIDEIDRVLARHYGFTEEELDFIINCDIKYRMGGDTAEDAE